MDHLRIAASPIFRAVVAVIGVLALFKGAEVTGVVQYTGNVQVHPFAMLRYLHHAPLKEPVLPKPVQAIINVPIVPRPSQMNHTIVDWSSDLYQDPEFDTTYSMDDLLCIKKVNASGISFDFHIFGNKSLSEQGSGNAEQKVAFNTYLPRFKNLLPLHRATILWGFKAVIRILAELTLYNNHVIMSAKIFDPKSVMVLVVFLGVTFGFNRIAASRRLLSSFQAKVTTLVSLRLAHKDTITLNLRTLLFAEQNEKAIQHTQAKALQSHLNSETALRESSAAAAKATKEAEWQSGRATSGLETISRQKSDLADRADEISSLTATNRDLRQKVHDAEHQLGSQVTYVERLEIGNKRLQNQLAELNESRDDRADRLLAELHDTQQRLNGVLISSSEQAKQLKDSESLVVTLTAELNAQKAAVEKSKRQVQSLELDDAAKSSQLLDDRDGSQDGSGPQLPSAPLPRSAPESEPAPPAQPEPNLEPEAEPQRQDTPATSPSALPPHLHSPRPAPPSPPSTISPQKSPQVQLSETDEDMGFLIKGASARARQQLQLASGSSVPQQPAPRVREQSQVDLSSPVPVPGQHNQPQHHRGSLFHRGPAPRGQDHQYRGRGSQVPSGPVPREQTQFWHGRGFAAPRGLAPEGRGQLPQHSRGYPIPRGPSPRSGGQPHQRDLSPQLPMGQASGGRDQPERDRESAPSRQPAPRKGNYGRGRGQASKGPRGGYNLDEDESFQRFKAEFESTLPERRSILGDRANQ